MDAIFGPLADATGASIDQIKLISCLLLSYPLASLFVRIPNSQPTLKHAFNIAVSSFYLLPMLNLYGGALQLLGSSLATYFIAKTNTSPHMPWIVFAVVMGHLTLNHIARAMFAWSYETFDVTGPQMVLVMKLSTFAWNVHDARRPVEKLDKWQKEFRVVDYPSILEFIGFAFYFPGMLIGPYLEFQAYRSLVDGSVFKSVERKDNAIALRQGSTMPIGRKRVAYGKMAMGLVYLGIYVTQYGSFNYSKSLEPAFMSYSLVQRILRFQVYGILERCKYYAIWTLTEGAAIATGLGFTGYSASGASMWEGAANIRVPEIELGSNFKMILDNWNIKTNHWLRECIYKRVTPEGKKPGFSSTMITFLTSAFWHGVAGGYYLAFAFGGFTQTAMRLCRNNFRPLFLTTSTAAQPSTTAKGPTKSAAPLLSPTPLKPLYDAASVLVSVLVLNFAAAPFMLLTIKDSFRCWSRLGWYGIVLVFGSLAFFWSGGGRLFKGKTTAKGPKEDVKKALS